MTFENNVVEGENAGHQQLFSTLSKTNLNISWMFESLFATWTRIK